MRPREEKGNRPPPEREREIFKPKGSKGRFPQLLTFPNAFVMAHRLSRDSPGERWAFAGVWAQRWGWETALGGEFAP